MKFDIVPTMNWYTGYGLSNATCSARKSAFIQNILFHTHLFPDSLTFYYCIYLWHISLLPHGYIGFHTIIYVFLPHRTNVHFSIRFNGLYLFVVVVCVVLSMVFLLWSNIVHQSTLNLNWNQRVQKKKNHRYLSFHRFHIKIKCILWE